MFYSEGGGGFVKTLEWKDFIRKLSKGAVWSWAQNMALPSLR